MLPRLVNVAQTRRESADVVTLSLAGEQPDFVAGQFNMLYAFGVGEIPISYSSGPGIDAEHTVRAVGPVSRALTQIEAGQTIGVRGPYGVGWPVPPADTKTLLLIAGGLGIAPLRPVIQEFLQQEDCPYELHVLYGARKPADFLFLAELQQWNDSGRLHFHCTVDQPTQGWDGDIGVVTTQIERLESDFSRTSAFICGPEVMLRFCIQSLAQKGLAASSIHVSLERNMKCATGHCGHCQLGPFFVCRDGPVFALPRVGEYLRQREC